MKLQRDTWLAIGLLLILTLVTVAAGIQQNKQAERPAYSSYSAQPNGALALRAWMNALGYEVLPQKLTSFDLPPQAQLIVMLEPFGITEKEMKTLDQWLRAGNTLLLSGVGAGTRAIAERYQISFRFSDLAIEQAFLQNPLLSSPPIAGPVSLRANYGLSSDRTDYVTYLASSERPLLISLRLGRGQLILSSAPALFSNRGLKETNAPAAVLNILSLAGTQGPVWFDEWHHGERSPDAEIRGPQQWLRNTAIGRALLFSAAIIFLGLLLQGRAFGRPVPLGRELRRRAPLEYIRAIANLGRRARHRGPVMKQYYSALKRGLGRRYRLNPSLPDDQYVAQLGQYNPNLDQAALLALLSGLQKKHLNETEMVKLAAEVAEWLKET
ncbi:MAG: DUF4350 domain-containing protein [Anaerolineales bacterium]|jgi:hypothetical protein|nr:DUF4350 domain-containing protein [Anaerolineales bacterium]